MFYALTTLITLLLLDKRKARFQDWYLSPFFTFGRITSETDGLEECDSGAGAQVEEVLFACLNDGLALVPVVVHVEPLALVVRLAPARAFPRDPSVSSAVQPVRRRPDKMIGCKYTVWQT